MMLTTKLKLAALLLAVLALGAAQATRGNGDNAGGSLERPDPDPQVVVLREPATIELNARTAYDPDTLTKIRPRFDTQVERVRTSVGQRVKKGEPLLELYSPDLAAAKSDFQNKWVQWRHDLELLRIRQKLVNEGAPISKQLWVDTQNDEKKSRLDYILARDKLKVLRVPESEIEPLLTPTVKAGKGVLPPVEFGDIENKARMTLVSPVDGVVIERDGVPRNLYKVSSVLMVIAPLDHLWVVANVPEKYRSKVRVGQRFEVQFPSLEKKIQGTLEYVGTEISKDTHELKVRASILNPGSRLKADMLVKLRLVGP